MNDKNVWYLPGPFHQYLEDVKALAKKAGLRIIDANVTESREDAAEDTPKVTIRAPAQPFVLVVDEGEQFDVAELVAQLRGIAVLINAVEGLAPLEHPGAGELAIRLFDVLKSINEGMDHLDGLRSTLADENEALRGEVEALKAAADQSKAEQDKTSALKAKLDDAGVSYRSNASIESLEKAVAELSKD
ncbi:hypothetical protein J3P85_19380 [Pseudomonas sp. Z1-12]|uniref:hypothetical protein n=1 Tax=Pseudomonas sp. Z1-12 TaxID=2817408 RepID=UPI003DA85BCA